MFSINNTILIGYPNTPQKPFTIRYIRPWGEDGSALISEDGNVWYPTSDKMLWSEMPTLQEHSYNNSMKRYNFTKQFDASKFSWKGSEGVACASDLGLLAGQVPYDQLYDDSIDTGLILKSPRTGVEKVFVLVGVTDFDGDTIKWSFTSVDGKLIVTIYND